MAKQVKIQISKQKENERHPCGACLRTNHTNFNRLKLGGCSNALRVGQNRPATEVDGVPEPRPAAAQAAAEAVACTVAGREHGHIANLRSRDR